MKNLLATLTVPALLIGGAAVASAQTDGGGGGGTDDDGTTESAEHRGHRARHGVFGRFVDALDLDRDAIRAAVEEGRTLAELADEQGVDIDAVIDQLVADAEARVAENPDSRFAERFDAEQFEERLTELVDREIDPDRHPHRHRGHRFGGGQPPAGSDDATASGVSA